VIFNGPSPSDRLDDYEITVSEGCTELSGSRKVNKCGEDLFQSEAYCGQHDDPEDFWLLGHITRAAVAVMEMTISILEI
jgi:hypothetical protein